MGGGGGGFPCASYAYVHLIMIAFHSIMREQPSFLHFMRRKTPHKKRGLWYSRKLFIWELYVQDVRVKRSWSSVLSQITVEHIFNLSWIMPKRKVKEFFPVTKSVIRTFWTLVSVVSIIILQVGHNNLYEKKMLEHKPVFLKLSNLWMFLVMSYSITLLLINRARFQAVKKKLFV